MLSVIQSISEGFKSFSIQTGVMQLSIIPELGGKINSLRDARTGREWLWRHPRREYKRVQHGSSYVAMADTGGGGESFSRVAECRYSSPPLEGAAVQNHCEVLSHPP